MNFTLKNYQFTASADILRALKRATRDYSEDSEERTAITLSAPTGAGKTVIAASVIESVFYGSERFSPDQDAVVLWVTDDPALNEQTMRNMSQASSRLGPGQMVPINSGFDQRVFESGNIYFLNIQKLSRSNQLTRSNTEAREYSLWETISNTIETNGAHFYVVIDEAHRGTKGESDRPTIIARIITGQDGINPPAPIVWGISATPENFEKFIAKHAPNSTRRTVAVDVDEVRSSGLLKDKIVLDSPKANQMASDTTLIREAVKQTLKFESDWATYASTQHEPPVVPALVVQVPNKPSDAEMSEVLGAVFGAWPGLTDANVVNTFGEHTALDVAGHTIKWMPPQNIQDDTDIRVILCKDAISTGWDCPRAEVLVSLRVAKEYTYIAQMIGRMVRTPLARRITTNLTLNDVHCYLPRFDRKDTTSIKTRFEAGKEEEAPVEVITAPVILEHNPAVPAEVFGMLENLPTYVVPGRSYRTQIARLHAMAALLAGDHIIDTAISQARIHLNGVLKTQRQRLEADGSFQHALSRVRNLQIERSYALIAAESLDDLPEEDLYEIDRDDNNIEDLFKVAKRKLPEGVATFYWNDVIDGQGDDDYDPTQAKAETAVLALHPEVVEAVEAAAEQLVQTWFREQKASISKLSDAKKAAYEPVRRETRKSDLTDLIVPSSTTVAETPDTWKLHLLADENGDFPFKPGSGWETKVLTRELADKDLVGWYRNPTGGTAAIRVPYATAKWDKSMYPDFVMFHRTDEGIRPSIIDPHGFHLKDARGKLRGLAQYAADHGHHYARIDAVAELKRKNLMALDLKSEAIRDAIFRWTDEDIEPLFEQHGGDYS